MRVRDSYERRLVLQATSALLGLEDREATARRVVDEHAARHPDGPPADWIWRTARPSQTRFSNGSLSCTGTTVRETRRERKRIDDIRVVALALLELTGNGSL
jgi:hypothetical protein